MFLAGFVSQGVLNKDPIVWLDGDSPANSCFPPSFLGNAPTLPSSILMNKVCLLVLYFIEYSVHFFTLKMLLKYSMPTIHGR
jgi:hypothetical protein